LLSSSGIRDFEIAYRLLIRGADYTLKNEHGNDLAHEVASTVGQLRPGSKGEKWQIKVIKWLEAKGVEIVENKERRH